MVRVPGTYPPDCKFISSTNLSTDDNMLYLNVYVLWICLRSYYLQKMFVPSSVSPTCLSLLSSSLAWRMKPMKEMLASAVSSRSIISPGATDPALTVRFAGSRLAYNIDWLWAFDMDGGILLIVRKSRHDAPIASNCSYFLVSFFSVKFRTMEHGNIFRFALKCRKFT